MLLSKFPRFHRNEFAFVNSTQALRTGGKAIRFHFDAVLSIARQKAAGKLVNLAMSVIGFKQRLSRLIDVLTAGQPGIELSRGNCDSSERK